MALPYNICKKLFFSVTVVVFYQSYSMIMCRVTVACSRYWQTSALSINTCTNCQPHQQHLLLLLQQSTFYVSPDYSSAWQQHVVE